MNKAAPLLATLLFLCGCSTWAKGSTCHVLIEEDGFSQEQLEKIHAAVAEWDKALEGYVKFDYVSQKGDEDLVVVRAREIDPVLQDNAHVGETFSDPWADGGGVDLPRNMSKVDDDAYFYRTALHEFGHALGLSHIDAPCVMNKRVDLEETHVTCNDIIEFCSHAGCDARTFRLCTV